MQFSNEFVFSSGQSYEADGEDNLKSYLEGMIKPPHINNYHIISAKVTPPIPSLPDLQTKKKSKKTDKKSKKTDKKSIDSDEDKDNHPKPERNQCETMSGNEASSSTTTSTNDSKPFDQVNAPQTSTPEVASELEFWRTLHSASIDPAVNILSLPVGVYFMGNSVKRSSIYVRDCYVELKDQIYAEFDQYEVNSTSTPTTDSMNGFVITGNPGTGKSCFLFYIMYLIARVKGTMVVHSIHAKNADSYYLYTYVGGIPVVRRGPKSDFITLLSLRSTFFLVDSKEETNVAAKTIIVSSPDPRINKHFLNNVGTTRWYMPPWCKSELDHVRPILYPNVTQRTELSHREDEESFQDIQASEESHPVCIVD
ncbi:hypothetical protein PPL_04920 [Heterostelium album PN500]|uniref:Uncharacterized protein n=1 Tax=Heterostelium pallidum (strain ATCC 26659 / Pp 5 / PN500) TaxID=670386 RepID=D3B8X7_HETP5|nr:hypothetical protein PPL_04920 [Heterostelium album PN500]EFA82495.1 hypothetical protein PPL_04920 [Heterostelium album PN500]|eukprot:XP_020434612.1 hypothetical protein PPL_04920 [Heterostelium album PN500]